MATAAASLQPLKPMVITPIVGTSTPDGSTSQTPMPATMGQRGEPHGFGVLQHTGPPIQDDIPGLYRDGRVRNPVPNKLKGKTDAKKGNFGVMHIDLTTTNESQERDAAAKRTSEGIQLAAKLAQTDRYVPIKRSKLVHRPDDEVASSSPQPTGSQDRTSPLTAAEIKAEQARLLTLLRSLHPVLVVDQLCKALAFFGGIPGAQASTDGTFPDSAEANGPGSLFVAWLAEIFPALDPESMANMSQATVKRPRGRPRGSKNSKGIKDKTFKMRLALDGRLAPASEHRNTGDGPIMDPFADDSWVDIDEAVAINEGDTVEVREEGTGRMTAKSPSNSRSTTCPDAPGGGPGSRDPGFTVATLTPRRRGRPKGSKNRPKDISLTNAGHKGAGDVDSAVTLENAELLSSVRKRKPGPGRPKGSKNRPKGPKAPEVAQTSESHTLSAPTVRWGEHTGEVRGSGTFEGGAQSPSVVARAHAELSQNLHQEPISLMPGPVTPQAPGDLGAVKSKAGGSKGVKRKRMSSVINPDTARSLEMPSKHVPPPVQMTTDITSQVVQRVEPPITSGTTAQQLTKRKDSKELPQKAAFSSKTNQSIGNSAVITDPVRLQVPQPTRSIGDYGATPVRVDDPNSVPSARNRLAISMSCSPHQQSTNSQNSVSDSQVGYNQNPRDPESTSKLLTAGTYPMTLSGRPSQSLHSQAAQAHYGQQTQRQQQQQDVQQQQQAPSRSHSYPEQRLLMNSSAGQLSSSTGRRDTDSLNASDGDSGYQGLISHQQSFGTQGTVSTSPGSSYQTSASRSVQNQSPAFQSRQVHHTPTSNMSSFQEYTDSPFLDMADLESASQGNLPIGHSSYSMTGGNMQRSSSTVNTSYNSASGMGHSLDGSMTESAFRERIYHTLRRQ